MARHNSEPDMDVRVQQYMLNKKRSRHMTPLEKLREAVLKENSTIKHLGSVFRQFDEKGNQRVGVREFKAGLLDLHIRVSPSDIREMFVTLDADKSGTIDFNEFLTAMRPPLQPQRFALVEQAFNELERTGDGVVTIDAIKILYNTDEDPLLESIEWKGATGLESLEKSFAGPAGTAKAVTRQEFIDYYTGISCTMLGDEKFTRMMQHSWKLQP